MDRYTLRAKSALATPIILSFLCCAARADDQIRVNAAAKPEKPLPAFADAKKVIVGYFEGLPGYQPGGILARGEVEPLFEHLNLMGWQVAEQKAITDRVPADDSFLVRQLRTPEGRKFMTQVSQYPLGYDRLDRLAKLPRGPELIRQFIRGPEGYKMIEYMTETPNGKNLGDMLSQASNGKNFNKPTGQIYTVDSLLDVLKDRYDEAKQAREKGQAATRSSVPRDR
jgi:hypothetical protein